MGYSTAIYAVDLARLRAAVGSRDLSLVKQLMPKKPAMDPEGGPRVMIDLDRKLFLNREPIEFGELIKKLRQRKWKGTALYLYDARKVTMRTPGWEEVVKYRYSIVNAVPDSQYEAIEMCFSEEQLYGGCEDEELTEEQAAVELVEGKTTRSAEGYQYGYGLEKLCKVLGTLVTAIDGKGGMLKGLKLKTPLSKERVPVKLPKWKDDFPLIGYLTAAEVEREVKRLEGMNLSYPKDERIEADRKELLRALQKAAKKKLGVVAFYH